MASESFAIELQTLTPIWTGDATSNCESIKESSIIGSLRWWYGEVVRASGGQVCINNKCNLGHEKFIKALYNGSSKDAVLDVQEICPVCQLFGCTGWSSKFKIIIEPNNSGKDISIYRLEVKSRIYKNSKRKVEGLMFDKNNLLKINFYPLKKIKDKEWEFLNTAINLISEWGALGGRTAQGNGVVKLLFNGLPKLEVDVDHLQYPNHKDFFFLKFHLRFKKVITYLLDQNSFWTNKEFSSTSKSWKTIWNEYEFLPIAFHIRDTIRRIEKDGGSRHRIFGKRGKGSKLFVSHGYRIDDKTIEFRIWGYGIGGNSSVTVESIEDILRNDLRSKLFVGSNDFIEDLTLEDQLHVR